MGRYPLQVQWLQRTISYWNKLVANKANSELLDFVLDAGLYQGLEEDHDCWALQLMHGLQLAEPDKTNPLPPVYWRGVEEGGMEQPDHGSGPRLPIFLAGVLISVVALDQHHSHCAPAGIRTMVCLHGTIPRTVSLSLYQCALVTNYVGRADCNDHYTSATCGTEYA